MSMYVYIEGGGSSKDLRARCREGFHDFLRKALGHRRKPRIVACGSRWEAFDDFKTKLRTKGTDDACLLLVDSEDVLQPDVPVWAHVRSREGDRWERPDGAQDDDLHFMAVCMESWLIADTDSLSLFFGDGFQCNALPTREDLENVPKHDVLRALQRATRATRKGEYRKGKLSFQALATVDASLVAKRMGYCRRFVARLTSWSQ